MKTLASGPTSYLPLYVELLIRLFNSKCSVLASKYLQHGVFSEKILSQKITATRILIYSIPLIGKSKPNVLKIRFLEFSVRQLSHFFENFFSTDEILGIYTEERRKAIKTDLNCKTILGKHYMHQEQPNAFQKLTLSNASEVQFGKKATLDEGTSGPIAPVSKTSKKKNSVFYRK